MTQKEFIKVLDEKGYSYEIEGAKIIVTGDGDGNVDLRSLTSLPPGVEVKNGGDVYLSSLTSLPPDVEFKNGDYVFLNSLTSISPGVEFRNGGGVSFESLIDVYGGYFRQWKGNIEGIDSKRLLNKMISIGLFDR